MTVSATAETLPLRGVRNAARACTAIFFVLADTIDAMRRSECANDELVIDETRAFDETVIDRDEWLAWAERNVSLRELELMRLAASDDPGQPTNRRPAAAVS